MPGGGKRVQVLGTDEGHEQERHDHAPAVELALLGLAENEKHERGVEEVLASGHAAIIRGHLPAVVGAKVEVRVELLLNPRVDQVRQRSSAAWR